MGKLSFSSYIEVVLRVKFIIDRENEGAPVHYWEKFGASANWARLGANAALLIHSWRYTKTQVHNLQKQKSKAQTQKKYQNMRYIAVMHNIWQIGCPITIFKQIIVHIEFVLFVSPAVLLWFWTSWFWWHLLPIKFTSLCSQLYIMYTTVYIVHRTLNCIKVVPWKHFQLN